MSKYYITTAIPYVNAKPHIGHALEFIQGDVIARYHKILGDDVLFLSGSDENAIKNVTAAEDSGLDIQKFVDQNADFFKNLAKSLNVDFDVFQKGSDKNHHLASQKLWELCDKSGDIYKKIYKGLYCVGCEAFYTSEELDENGECFEHPGKKLEEVEEENYFFKLSKYQDELIKIISADKYKITPSSRKNEILSFLKNPLQDISISRTNKRAKDWGVDVPNDSSQKIYVWFDALNIYQSGIGFGTDAEKYQKWWPANVHVVGKGITRFHAIYWPAFLLSAKLELPKELFVHEYITVNGQKMSKTVGNVLDPIPLIEKLGADALRYYCLAKISPFSDSDFSEDKFRETYNADLANGLGNLIARIAKLAEKIDFEVTKTTEIFDLVVTEKLKEFKFNEALSVIWQDIAALDKKINEVEPWKLEEAPLKEFISESSTKIHSIALSLKPFLPETSEKILKQFSGKIKSGPSLFPRIG
ncbi:MAG: methionine--tRNA ligase [Microgenomates group bacterium]|jgi:methionyl-tRNA synthetase